MAEPISVPQEIDALPEATVKYWADDQVLEIHNGKALGDGEEIAQFITVFYDRENENEVVAVRLDLAEYVLKPFVDAILAKYGVSLDILQFHKQAKVNIGMETAEAD
ncbi:MAG: hypothetical protein OXH22_07370 [Chloroflexi bacterium]|nr:hypothetical protein [Chloroflexota bacterium]